MSGQRIGVEQYEVRNLASRDCTEVLFASEELRRSERRCPQRFGRAVYPASPRRASAPRCRLIPGISDGAPPLPSVPAISLKPARRIAATISIVIRKSLLPSTRSCALGFTDPGEFFHWLVKLLACRRRTPAAPHNLIGEGSGHCFRRAGQLDTTTIDGALACASGVKRRKRSPFDETS